MIDQLSLISLLIEPCFDDERLGFATGFIVKDGGNIYLATNWHVVTGKHPVTEKIIHKEGGLPNSLIVWFHKTFTSNNISWTPIKIPLYESKRIEEGKKDGLSIQEGKILMLFYDKKRESPRF